MHWTRRLLRGVNGPELLAEAVAGSMRLPIDTRLLSCRRRTKKQGTLLPSARRLNVHGAYGVARGGSLAAKRVLLVDDVLTTGATLDELARVLQRAGRSRCPPRCLHAASASTDEQKGDGGHYEVVDSRLRGRPRGHLKRPSPSPHFRPLEPSWSVATRKEVHPLRLGTRGSALALWQAEWIAGRLRELGTAVELIRIQTAGDVSSQPLQAGGGQGLFTKEIQRALLDDRIDLAVHSLKDLPTEPVPGLVLAAVPPRESCGDVLVSNTARCLADLPPQAIVGTGSQRRRCQLLHHRPDLHVGDIRGNVDTRLRKLDEGEYDAIILAAAGLKRLGWSHRIAEVIPPSVMLPAVGQGAGRRDAE